MRNRALLRLFVALLSIAVVATACGDDESADVLPESPDDATEPPGTEPPATEPPATEPAATEPPTSEPPSTVPAADDTISLDLVDGQLVGGVREEAVSIGDEVTIVVTGNTDGEIHVHGYNEFIELTGGQGELTFDAEIPGIFEVELEATGRLLLRLEVS